MSIENSMHYMKWKRVILPEVSEEFELVCILSDSNWTRTRNHLVHKRTLNHLAKLA